MDILSKLFDPKLNFTPLVIQGFICYFIYQAYKILILKGMKSRAYQSLVRDRFVKEEVAPQKTKPKEKKEEQAKVSKITQQVQTKPKKVEQEEEMKSPPPAQQAGVSYKELLKKSKSDKIQHGKEKSAKSTQKINHPAYQSAIKGFGDFITDFAYNNKYVCVAAADKSIKVFHIAQFFQNAENPKFIFYNLEEGQYATAVAISQIENRIYFAESNQIHILSFNPDAQDHKYFRLEKTFPQKCQKKEITNLYVDQHDRFLITTGEDTFIKIWSMNGALLKELNTSYGQHYHSFYNIKNNYLVPSAWSSDTSIFEVKVNKDHSFSSFEKVMPLRGEKGRVIDASVDQNGLSACLVTKDIVKFFSIGKDTQTLRMFKVDEMSKLSQLNAEYFTSSASFTDDHFSLYAVGFDRHLILFNKDFELIDKIEDAALGKPIKKIVLKEYANVKNKIMVCFVWGEGEERINLFNFSKLVYE